MGDAARVLIVDDSAYVRKVVRQMLAQSPNLEVVGAARDGEEALELVAELRPDVVTLDLNMPRLDGVEFIRRQMALRPVPIVLLSAASESGDEVMRALDAGAVDVVQKPTALASERVLDVAADLVAKVTMAAAARLRTVPPPVPEPQPISVRGANRTDIVVIGVSTGGPQALKQFVPRLPPDFPAPVAVVLHMPIGFTEAFARSLDEASALKVTEARHGERLDSGMVVVAPAGYHLTVSRAPGGGAVARLGLQPLNTPHRPAVDVLFRSAAEAFGDRVLAVVMTGMGSDGTAGAAWVKAEGGRVFSESEETSVVYGMPRSVVEAGLSDASVPLYDMARAVIEAL